MQDRLDEVVTVLIYYMGLPGKRKRGLARENISKPTKEIVR